MNAKQTLSVAALCLSMAAYSQYGSFTVLAENNRTQMQGLIEELAKAQNQPGSIAQKVGDLYNIAMDSVKLNEDGIKPIQAEMEEINSLTDKSQLYAFLPSLAQRGIGGYLGLYVGADEKNAQMNAVQIGQSGLSMGERDYYLAEDEATTKIREAFKAHIVKMFQLAGYDEATAARARDIVMDVETRLAKAFRSRVELRDPQANYNKMTLAELKKTYPTFDWDAYLGGFGLKDVQEIIVGQPASLAESAKILDTLPLDQQKLYLQWKLIDASASCLSDALNEQNFDFYSRTMSGQKEQQPRWKRAVSTVSGVLGEAVGQMYVEKYFPAAAKERMVALVRNLQTASRPWSGWATAPRPRPWRNSLPSVSRSAIPTSGKIILTWKSSPTPIGPISSGPANGPTRKCWPRPVSPSIPKNGS